MSGDNPVREAALLALCDKAELYDVAMRYCRAIDRRDPVLLRSVYHDDGHDNHGSFFDGPAADFIARLPQTMAPFAVTTHHICNTMYRLDGDRAEGELYFVAFHRTLPPSPKHISVRGRYLDRYERRSGEWRIVHRSLVWDSYASSDVLPADAEVFNSLGDTGAAEGDASYQALRLFGRGVC